MAAPAAAIPTRPRRGRASPPSLRSGSGRDPAGRAGRPFLARWGAALRPLGDGFIKLVKMIIAPVIFLTVVLGIAGMSEMRAVGRVAAKAFAYFLFFSTLALIVGLIVANVVRPGAGMNVDPATLNAGAIATYAERAHDSERHRLPARHHPDDDGLGADRRLDPAGAVRRDPVRHRLVAGRQAGRAGARHARAAGARSCSASSRILMRAAPIGAFGAIAFTIGAYGIGTLVNLGALVATFYLTSLIFVLVVLGGVAALAGFSILKLIRYLKAELLLVLGTSSSEAALPALIEKMERAGCARAGGRAGRAGRLFVQPRRHQYLHDAGGLVHRPGDADRASAWDQVALLLVAMVSSKGAAGVTGAGFITLAATLSIVPTVPVAGMALILGVDRFMSECRSLTNFIGNAVATIVVARWEGALDREKLEKALIRQPRGTPAVEPAEGDHPED